MSTCRAEKPSGKKCALKNSFAIAGAMRRAPRARQRHQDHRHVEMALMVGREHDRPARCRSRCSSPLTRTHAKMRASGRIHVAWLTRRIEPHRPARDSTTGSRPARRPRLPAAPPRSPRADRRASSRPRTSSRRCASGTDLRARPSARRARASSGRALRSTCRHRAARAPANFASSACSGSSPVHRGRRRRARCDPRLIAARLSFFVPSVRGRGPSVQIEKLRMR